MPQLEGRVFSRLQQYEALPSELKDEVSALVDYLTTAQHDVFGLHHANLLKTVRSVRAKPLTEKITAWLLQKEMSNQAPAEAVSEEVKPAEAVAEADTPAEATTDEPKPAETTEATAEPTTEATAEPTTVATAETPAAPTADEAAKAKEAAAKAKEEAAATLKAEQEAAAARLAHAKKLLEALVLKGFVTPYKESEKTTTPEPWTFKDSELFVPLAPEVAREPATPAAEASTSVQPEASAASAPVESTEHKAEAPEPAAAETPTALPTTVWDLVEGAVFAGALKRKAGFLAPLTSGKDVYAVVNARRKTLTLFESDVGRVPILELGFEGTSVAFDKSHFVHGVKVWNETLTELLNASTKLEREALVHSLLAIGLTYHEDLAPGLEKVETIYELRDTDMDGQEVSFDTYKGKVLLVVNVSSKCGLTPTNYPELVALHDKYRAQGFEVLAFPCNQFMGQEPGTHDEIKAFVAQYNPTFQFFAKGDVNGVDARPVFAFLKHKLPATHIQWNFTKFLVDRNGVPVKRFGPQELPLSFEGEIVKLIAEEATAPPAAETTTTEATTEATAATATAATATTTTETVAETAPEPAPVAAVEPTPEAAPVEETKAPAEPEKPAVVETVPAVVETKVEAAAVPEPTPEAPVEPPKVEEVVKVTEAPPQTTAVEPASTKVEPAAEATSNQSTPVQGFTPGNEPTSAP